MKTRYFTILFIILSGNCLDGKLDFSVRDFVTIKDLLQELQGFRPKRMAVLAKDLEELRGALGKMRSLSNLDYDWLTWISHVVE